VSHVAYVNTSRVFAAYIGLFMAYLGLFVAYIGLFAAHVYLFMACLRLCFGVYTSILTYSSHSPYRSILTHSTHESCLAANESRFIDKRVLSHTE